MVANTTVHITEVKMNMCRALCMEENPSWMLIVPRGPRPMSDDGRI